MKRQRNDITIGSCERAPIPKIYNVVASIHLQLIGTNLRLRQIASKTSNSQFNPRRFSALIMRIIKPRTTALIFKNGKIIITGSKSEVEIRLAARKIIKKLKVIVGEDKVIWNGLSQICNVVGSVNTRLSIDLQKMMDENNQAQYNPNIFPGLIFRVKNPRVTFLVFSTGKIVITGAKSQQIIEQSFLKLYNILLKYRKQRNI